MFNDLGDGFMVKVIKICYFMVMILSTIMYKQGRIQSVNIIKLENGLLWTLLKNLNHKTDLVPGIWYSDLAMLS